MIGIKRIKSIVEDPNSVAKMYCMIWVDKDGFLSDQYIDKLSESYTIKYSDKESTVKSSINVIKSDEMDLSADLALNDNNIYLCKSIINNDKRYDNRISIFPSLERWQVLDYIYCMVPSLTVDDRKKLYDSCSGDMRLISNIVNKLRVLGETEQKEYFKYLFSNYQLCAPNTTALLDAVLSRNTQKVQEIFKNISVQKYLDGVEFFHRIYKIYREIATLYLVDSNKSDFVPPGMTDIRANQIKMHYGKFYKKEDIVTIMVLLSNLDYLIASSSIKKEDIIPYIVCIVFGKES